MALSGAFTLITPVNISRVLARTGGSDIGLFVALPAMAALAGRRLRKARKA